MTEHVEDPLELSQKFWKAMCVKGGMTTVNAMISPDCYMKDGFGSGARGVHDIEAISAKLTEINGKIYGGAATFEMDIPFRVMRNKIQVRFITTAKVGWITITIGFALEFECGFIIKIILMKNPGKGIFETDDTKEAVVPVQEVVSNTALEETCETSESDSVKNDTKDECDDSASRLTKKEEDVNEENIEKESMEGKLKKGNELEEIDQSFYFGKFLGRARPRQEGADKDSEGEDEADAPHVPLANTLHPPFLTSKPPEIPPTVVVTVVGCANLKSPLKRIVERDVNAFVSVHLKDKPIVQSTPVAQPGSSPVFSRSNKFVFEAPSVGGTVVFTVYDKKSISDNLVIAEVHVPLASIATTSPSNSSPTVLSLPLHIQKQMSRFTKPKHRPSVSGVKMEDVSPEVEPAVLDVLISKIDIMKWWALEELKARDEARDKKEAEEEAARREELQRQASKEEAIAVKRTAVLAGKGREHDSEVTCCSRCKEEFTLFRRMYHCHFCLLPLCDDCSPHEALLDEEMHRCCKDCMKDEKRHTSSSSLPSQSQPTVMTAQSTLVSTASQLPPPPSSNDSEEEEERPVVKRMDSTDANWESDDSSEACRICKEEFSFFLRRHHCRVCGRLVCGDCSPEEIMIAGLPERCCKDCLRKHGNNEEETVADESECTVS